jgi:hypothetical protein
MRSTPICHEHETSFATSTTKDTGIDVSASFAQIKALVQEAAGNPVASAMASSSSAYRPTCR